MTAPSVAADPRRRPTKMPDSDTRCQAVIAGVTMCVMSDNEGRCLLRACLIVTLSLHSEMFAPESATVGTVSHHIFIHDRLPEAPTVKIP